MADDLTDDDIDRGHAVLVKALRMVADSWIPVEIVILITLRERLDPKDAVTTAYLLGRCGGDIEKLNEIEREWRANQ